MKKILLLLYLIPSLLVFGQRNVASFLYDDWGLPSEPLAAVLEDFNVSHDESWESIVALTQRDWLRPLGLERWQVEPQTSLSAPQLFSLFSELGMLKPVWPERKHYEAALLLGSSVQRVRMHLNFLAMLWRWGIQYDELVLLGSERPLDTELEGVEELLDSEHSPFRFREKWSLVTPLPHTEMGMMEMVFDQLELPKEMREVGYITINTPMVGEQRPTTADTFDAYLATFPKVETTLIVSGQPFVARGDSIARQKLEPVCDWVESVGAGVTFNLFKAYPNREQILLDELARVIYQEVVACSEGAG